MPLSDRAVKWLLAVLAADATTESVAASAPAGVQLSLGIARVIGAGVAVLLVAEQGKKNALNVRIK
jgi:hypothetical protein